MIILDLQPLHSCRGVFNKSLHVNCKYISTVPKIFTLHCKVLEIAINFGYHYINTNRVDEHYQIVFNLRKLH